MKLETTRQLNEEGTLSVLHIGTPHPTISSMGGSFEDALAKLNEFRARILSMHFCHPGEHFDFSRIKHSQDLLWIHIQFAAPCQITMPKHVERAFSGLVQLNIGGKLSADFPAASCKSLKALDLACQPKVNDWKRHDGIVDLVLRGFSEVDLSSLSGMKSLKRLCLVGGSIKSLKGIEALPALETLMLYKTQQLLSVEALLNCETLTALHCEAYRKITDWSLLAAKKNLEFLSFQEVQSAEFVADLPALKFVYFRKIADKNSEPVKQHVGMRAHQADAQAAPLPFYERLVDVWAIAAANPIDDLHQKTDLDKQKSQLARSAVDKHEPGSTLSWSDGELLASVERVGQRNPKYTANGDSFNASAALVDTYQCTAISVHATNLSMDFSTIARLDQVLELEVAGKGRFNFPRALYAQFSGLRSLTVDASTPTFMSDIQLFPALLKLEFSNNEAVTFQRAQWAEHTGVIDLIIGNLRANDLRGLAGMKSLKRIWLWNSSISSLDGIEAPPNLETLIIGNATKLRSFDAIFNSNVRHLSINSIHKDVDLSFLTKLTQLKTIRFYRAPSVQFMAALPGLEIAVCDHIGDKDRSPIETHPGILQRRLDEAAARAQGHHLSSGPLWDRNLPEVIAVLGTEF